MLAEKRVGEIVVWKIRKSKKNKKNEKRCQETEKII
jgi:hypothetical protein